MFRRPQWHERGWRYQLDWVLREVPILMTLNICAAGVGIWGHNLSLTLPGWAAWGVASTAFVVLSLLNFESSRIHADSNRPLCWPLFGVYQCLAALAAWSLSNLGE